MKNHWLEKKRQREAPVAGYFYAPYVPLCSTPTVLDPETFIPRKGILTRYGKKLLEEGTKYYSTVTIGEDS